MTTINISQPLPFDIGAAAGDWLSALGDLGSSFTIEALSSSHIVIAATGANPLAGWKIEILPQSSFGLMFSPPYFSGAIGGLNVIDPGGHVLASVTDLPAGATFQALTSGGLLASLAAEVHGSAGADSISGGSGADVIDGGAGDDLVNGGDGLNYLRGGDGGDRITGGSSFDDINGNVGNDTEHGGGGDDWVVGGKDNDALFGDDGLDIVYGNLGDDSCDGGAGADLIRGGQGNDVLAGGAGSDWLSGDRGDDTLSGGAGADIFHSFAQAGVDRVTDFNAGEGDRVMLDPGTAYTVSQVGADTVVDMGGGNQVVLVGVTLSGLPSGWIFGA